MKNFIAMDFAGRYPVTSKRVHKYIFIMYNFENSYIKAVSVKSQETDNYIEAFQLCYDNLCRHGVIAQLLHLDNEMSKALIERIETNKLDFQIVSPGNHCVNDAERAIQTFKSYFKSAHAEADPSFPKDCWDLLIPQTNLIMNLVWSSRINPAISAYNQIHGSFDFN